MRHLYEVFNKVSIYSVLRYVTWRSFKKVRMFYLIDPTDEASRAAGHLDLWMIRVRLTHYQVSYYVLRSPTTCQVTVCTLRARHGAAG